VAEHDNLLNKLVQSTPGGITGSVMEHLRSHPAINNIECFAAMLPAATPMSLWTRPKFIYIKTVYISERVANIIHHLVQ